MLYFITALYCGFDTLVRDLAENDLADRAQCGKAD